jgi:hypothetical protein
VQRHIHSVPSEHQSIRLRPRDPLSNFATPFIQIISSKLFEMSSKISAIANAKQLLKTQTAVKNELNLMEVQDPVTKISEHLFEWSTTTSRRV